MSDEEQNIEKMNIKKVRKQRDTKKVDEVIPEGLENISCSKGKRDKISKILEKNKNKIEMIKSNHEAFVKDADKYVMYFKTSQSSAIRTLHEALKEVLLDVNIFFDETGYCINSIDTSRVSFIHLKLDADRFECYYCPKPITIGVNMIGLHKLLKKINNDDIISMYILKEQSNKLFIKIESTDEKINSISKYQLLDLDNEIIQIPDIKFNSVNQMPFSSFQKNCRDLSTIADHVRFYSNDEIFTMSATGNFAEQTIQVGSEETPGKPLNFIGTYKLKFLNLFCKATGLCPTIQIYLREGYPLILTYSIAALGTIKFGLSPDNTIE